MVCETYPVYTKTHERKAKYNCWWYITVPRILRVRDIHNACYPTSNVRNLYQLIPRRVAVPRYVAYMYTVTCVTGMSSRTDVKCATSGKVFTLLTCIHVYLLSRMWCRCIVNVIVQHNNACMRNICYRDYAVQHTPFLYGNMLSIMYTPINHAL